MSAEHVWYIDSSALVKLDASEPETPALSNFLTDRHQLVCSALAETEVNRAVLPLGERFAKQASQVLARIELIRITNEVLTNAGRLKPATVRSLHAIHLATAALLGDTLGAVITYDGRMTGAAELLGWVIHAPV